MKTTISISPKTPRAPLEIAARGLVRRDVDPADRRHRIVRLTDSGH